MSPVDLTRTPSTPTVQSDSAERRQGRLNRPAGELSLMHWLTMRLERVIPATELFATFRQSGLRPASDAEALVRELVPDAKVWRALRQFAIHGTDRSLTTVQLA